MDMQQGATHAHLWKVTCLHQQDMLQGQQHMP